MTDRIARVVADADVLAADLLAGGKAREALDMVRSHTWIDLVASGVLLDDAETVIAELADGDLASDWRAKIEGRVEIVEHPPKDHPGLAAVYRGEAGHLLTCSEELRSAKAGAALNEHVDVSVRHPDAFVRVFDPATAYEVTIGGEYPGPDCDPRS